MIRPCPGAAPRRRDTLSESRSLCWRIRVNTPVSDGLTLRRPSSGVQSQTIVAGRPECMQFTPIGEIRNVETIAQGHGIREISELRELYGPGRWRKRKGVATVQIETGEVRLVELHWYEAHGIGKRRMKIKRYLDR